MSDVLTAAAELNKRLRESSEYLEYLKARAELEKFPEYRQKADDFRKRQIEHEIRKINGDTPDTDELSLANDYADVCLIHVCNDFFQAEIQLLALIKGAYGKICEGLEIDV